jgi:hypothetical protein
MVRAGESASYEMTNKKETSDEGGPPHSRESVTVFQAEFFAPNPAAHVLVYRAAKHEGSASVPTISTRP